ncbi:hypothetical protein M0R45_027768 [Rubus argutus]|uniref:Uncharacterized protein n=1 Tax=Rubus argutus TaxID=59490 RepID=A0AAW1X1C0_RUBAR
MEMEMSNSSQSVVVKKPVVQRRAPQEILTSPPPFAVATILITLLELHVRHYWKIGFTANFLVSLGSKYSLYSIVLPLDQEIRQRITLICPLLSLCFFTTLGLISLAICCLTVADIVVFNMHTLRCLQLQLYSQLYWQSCLRFLVSAGLIIAGITNIIEKAWHGDMALHKNAILLSLCVLSFIRFREPCYCYFLHELSKIEKDGKRTMIVVPVVEEKDD